MLDSVRTFVSYIDVFVMRQMCYVLKNATGSGFKWANFEFDMGRKQSDPGSTRRTETTGKTSTTCNAIRDDLHDYFVGLRNPSGPVSKFFDRQFTCAVVLLLIYSVRHVLRRLQIWYYYDDPPPPDMGFPGWEGPVFVAQLFGISDTAAALFTVDCRAWMIVGILWMLAGPFAFLCYSNHRVYSLIHYSKTLRFNKSSTHRIPEMFDKLRHLPGGCLAKSAQCFIFAMDIRFQGVHIEPPSLLVHRERAL